MWSKVVETLRQSSFGMPPFHLKSWKYLRMLIFVSVDLVVVFAAYALAFYLRLESFEFGRFQPIFWTTSVIFCLACTVCFWVGGLHRQIWRYANFYSAVLIAKLVFLSTVVAVATTYLLFPKGFPPRSVPVMFWFIATTGLIAQKFSWRVWASFKTGSAASAKKRAVIYGAGSAGELVARYNAANPQFPYRILGFVDDDRNKHGKQIHGLKIFGGGDKLAELARKRNVTVAVLAIHSAPGRVIRKAFEICESAGLEPLIMPDMANVMGKDLIQPRKVNISDLLRRSPASTSDELLSAFFKDQVVLVSGAGGSIGSEICRQVRKYNPKRIVMMDFSEFSLFKVDAEMQNSREYQHVECIPILGTCADADFVREVFGDFSPDIVLHAAAYKHVPMLERNIKEGIQNNILATMHMAQTAGEFGCKCFLLVSSDKAVRPVNVMGATKRCSELLVQCFSQEFPKTIFCSVRFGNVLGSSGSVVPQFLAQIQAGGPVTVTHPDITRFFMLIEEAVGLVLQSAAMARGGETFVLNMGEPVKIYDMARHLITLAGKQPGVDIEIEITGLRPGEKLYEELILEGSEDHTLHEDVFIAKSHPVDRNQILTSVRDLLGRIRDENTEALKAILFRIIGMGLPNKLRAEESRQVVIH